MSTEEELYVSSKQQNLDKILRVFKLSVIITKVLTYMLCF